MTITKQNIALFLLPAVALGITAWVWLDNSVPENTSYLLAEPKHCQLHHAPCYSNDEQISVTLDITPKPVPIAKALAVSTQITGVTPTRVQLDINGSNMYMGYNRIDLTAQADGSWTGKTLLAFCTIDQMSWQFTVMIDTAEGRQIQAPFPLVTPYQ
jgi:hypothetical protein